MAQQTGQPAVEVTYFDDKWKEVSSAEGAAYEVRRELAADGALLRESWGLLPGPEDDGEEGDGDE